MTKMTQLRHHKILPTALIAAALIALPATASVYAQTTTDSENNDETTVTKQQETQNENTDTTDKTPVETEEPTVTETPAPTQNEEPTDPVSTAVTLAQAQAIAETEHPESVVMSSKTKAIDSQTVYVFTFADGWKVYVRAADGTVIKVQDKANKDHACQNKHKKSGVYGGNTKPNRSADSHATSASWRHGSRDNHGDHKSHHSDRQR